MGPMQTPLDISYLSDAVLMLRYFDAEGRVRRAMGRCADRKCRLGDTCPISEGDHCFFGHYRPTLVARQRPGRDDGYDVVRRGLLRKVDSEVLVNQSCGAKRGASGYPDELGGAEAKKG